MRTTTQKILSKLLPHQISAVNNLRTGTILWGGVGSGKSCISLAYYLLREYPKDLYVITTAAKRDTGDWENELLRFDEIGLTPVIDSWNNIKKYKKVIDSFFIFDEQRLIGSGSWVKTFLAISKSNRWIILSATPGDTWLDYIPVFVANGFYKNRTEFLIRHVIYNKFSKYPKIEKYFDEDHLEKLKKQITVFVPYTKPTITHIEDISVFYDSEKYKKIRKDRWNIEENRPIRTIAEFFYIIRKAINSDSSRMDKIIELIEKHGKLIIFYNFNYELEILRQLKYYFGLDVTEYNGQNHEEISSSRKWVHLVQYNAGSEGWNCTATNVIVFYSLNYSYRIMQQAAGRIDRLNTPFLNLYYYRLVSESDIDKAILKALKNKKSFNENRFAGKTSIIIEENDLKKD